MTEISRRDALKALGVAGVGLAAHGDSAPQMLDSIARSNAPPIDILPLTSTSEVFTPPRGRSYNTFSFDFPEPSVEFYGYRFAFIVFTNENAYALDSTK